MHELALPVLIGVIIIAREIYKHLERITDAFEDVANEIDGIVIDHT